MAPWKKEKSDRKNVPLQRAFFPGSANTLETRTENKNVDKFILQGAHLESVTASLRVPHY
jgi:hypothetical protein